MVKVAHQSGCKILLDVNNIYVSSQNHGFCASSYVQTFQGKNLVKEIHLAGHREIRSDLLVDDHGSAISSPVWDLYLEALTLLGPLPTLIEWDNHIPSLGTLLEEAQKAQKIMERLYEFV